MAQRAQSFERSCWRIRLPSHDCAYQRTLGFQCFRSFTRVRQMLSSASSAITERLFTASPASGSGMCTASMHPVTESPNTPHPASEVLAYAGLAVVVSIIGFHELTLEPLPARQHSLPRPYIADRVVVAAPGYVVVADVAA